MEDLPQGWLTAAEATELQVLSKGKVVLELGAWKGRSTVVFSEVAKYVISVDRHQGINSTYPEDSLPDYLANVRNKPNVAIIVADFSDISKYICNVDLVYVDGDHDRIAVERDTMIALSTKPSLVAYHDWDFPEVSETVIGILGKPEHVVGSVASFHT